MMSSMSWWRERMRAIVYPLVMTGLCLLPAARAQADKRMPTPAELLTGYGVALTPAALIEALQSGEGAIRENAAVVVGERGLKQAVPALKTLLDDDYPNARVAAAGALLRLGDESGLALLRQQIAGPDAPLAALAARAIAAAGRDAGYEQLRERVTVGTDSPLDRVLLVRALPAYRTTGGHESTVRDALIDVLGRDASLEVRRAAADELTAFSGPAVTAAFRRASTDDPDAVVKGIAQAYVARQR